ncbi:Uncharacterised protein [Mycobacteroides abscessus subsp. abscessus]|nr:Uncharacterised protein [Mycobacteroides abscessus subsp. abscessus]
MITIAIVCHTPFNGSTRSPIPTDCSNVFNLPPRLAGITAYRITQKRRSVTHNSRTRMMPVTHQLRSPRMDRPMSAAPISALSAIGSAIFPKSVTSPRSRASLPSTLSVNAAPAKMTAATIRHTVSCPPSMKSTATNTGTSRMRNTVSALAMLTTGTGSTGSVM